MLAAINEIETDYGRNLSVSSAGAVGWMQFLPSTWKTWGVDANGDGVADPYNPADAIFTAARYLHAAGASKNLTQAVFAYNHATWYVQSVLLRAKLIGGMPNSLVGALTGLVQGHFPVAAPAKYADSAVDKLAGKKVHSGNAAIAVESDPKANAVSIFAKQNAPVIAVNDGKILQIGQNAQWGNYVESPGRDRQHLHLLQPGLGPQALSGAQAGQADGQAAGQGALGSRPERQADRARERRHAEQLSRRRAPSKATKEVKSSAPLTLPVTPAPAAQSQPQGQQQRHGQGAAVRQSVPARLLRRRRLIQIKNAAAQISSFRNYFSDVLHLGKNQYTLEPLKKGSIVVAGTILGRIGASTASTASHMVFMIQPAGKNAPYIDPKPILDGWKLLEATAVYRAAGVDPFFGPGAKNPTVGQVLLMSKAQLQSRVLVDPHVQIYACGRRDIQAGLIDRRVLATIEFLSASGL